MTADCGSVQVECNGAGAVPPATLAEFTLNGSSGQDFYDVSLVDGYNLPMIMESTGGSGGCQTTGCLVDLNRRCPTELQSEGGDACRSACEAFGNPEYCCSGEYSTPATCKPTAYSQLFKRTCPRAYSYAFDDASSTFTCSGGDYIITFCPSTPSQKSSTDPSPVSVGANLGTNSASGAAGSGDSPFSASWLANLATGNSSNASHPSITLQFVLLLGTITSLVTSLHN